MLLGELKPTVVIINGTRIIKERTLQSIDAHFINMHAGITPLYRGVHGGYWALCEGNPEYSGVTVHLVDTGIDTGGILGQEKIRPIRKDSFVTYPLLQIAAGVPLLKNALNETLKSEIKLMAPPPGTSRLYYHPTLWEYVVGYIKTGTK